MSFLRKSSIESLTDSIESTRCCKILIVGQDPQKFETYRRYVQEAVCFKSDSSLSVEMIREPGFAGTDFLEQVERSQPQLVILSEVNSPIDLLTKIKRISPSTSVVIISSSSSIEEAVEAMRSGAEDYLPHAFKPDYFRKMIRKELNRNTLKKNQLVYMDEATGLFNIRYLNDLLEIEIDRSRRTGNSFAVLFLDLDRFKLINDRYGHTTGNRILNELGEHLKKYVRERDRVFRYGGDEFVTVLSPCDLQTAEQVAERIRHSLEWCSLYQNEGISIRCTVSIGVALFPDHATSKTDLIEAADLAMYAAKRTQRNRIEIAESKSSRLGVEGFTYGSR